MTLKDYCDIIRTKLRDHDLPLNYLKLVVNWGRREIAQRTRCIQCFTSCESVAGNYFYQVPSASNDSRYVDCVEVLDVFYDGVKLARADQQLMKVKLEQTTTQGVPRQWGYFGGDAQPTGLIMLWPTPSESLKQIKAHTIQFPLPLLAATDVCELNDVIQKLVVDYVVGEHMLTMWHPQGPTILNRLDRAIKRNVTMKKARIPDARAF